VLGGKMSDTQEIQRIEPDNQLAIIIKESNLAEAKAKVLLDNFSNYFEIAADWERKARAILVTDSSQIAEMEMARTGRLFLREKRIAIEKTRKQLKEQALREGKAIDGIANVLKALIVPIEEYLGQQERYTQIKAAEAAEAERLAAEKKAEEERIAKEKAEAEEQERIRKENERLRKEAEEKERILAEERAKIEKERRAREAEKIAYKKQAEKERAKAQAGIEARERLIANQKAQAEAEKEERKLEQREVQRIQKQLTKMIECPFCHKKFSLID